jgi:hypothetical protein
MPARPNEILNLKAKDIEFNITDDKIITNLPDLQDVLPNLEL